MRSSIVGEEHRAVVRQLQSETRQRHAERANGSLVTTSSECACLGALPVQRLNA
jgi:hypothetical protein